jgi:hypothetical protein
MWFDSVLYGIKRHLVPRLSLGWCITRMTCRLDRLPPRSSAAVLENKSCQPPQSCEQPAAH